MIKIASNITNLLNKQAALSDYLKNDYVRYGAGGALGGAALGAIINKLMGGSALKGGLLGAGLGGAAGLGAAGIKGYRKNQERLANEARAASFVGNRTPEEEQAARDYTARMMGLPDEAPAQLFNMEEDAKMELAKRQAFLARHLANSGTPDQSFSAFNYNPGVSSAKPAPLTPEEQYMAGLVRRGYGLPGALNDMAKQENIANNLRAVPIGSTAIPVQ
jgi:hypothetical protein